MKPATIPREKLAWMAAVLDMKGTIIIKANNQRATPQIVLMVESTHVGVIAELARLTGSEVEPRDKRPRPAWMRRGCIEHCPEPDVEYPGQPDYLPAQTRWTVTGAAAAVVLHSVIPYMVTDKGMEKALEEIMGNVDLHGRSGNAARQAVTRLAGLGWRLPGKIGQQARELALAS